MQVSHAASSKSRLLPKKELFCCDKIVCCGRVRFIFAVTENCCSETRASVGVFSHMKLQRFVKMSPATRMFPPTTLNVSVTR